MNQISIVDVENSTDKSFQGFTVDYGHSNGEFKEYNIKNSILNNVGMGRAKIINSKITQTTMKDCYFRNATFQGVDFTGTKFVNCNFEKANFRICVLNYVEFSKCKLNIDEILGNLPSQSNLKISLLKQLLINQTEMAEKKSCDRLTLMIAEEERNDWKDRFLNKNSYYNNNMTTLNKLSALYKYIINTISGFIWGYGLKLSRLFRFAVLSIIVFAFIIYQFDLTYLDKLNGNVTTTFSFKDALIHSFLVFSNNGYGEYLPYGPFANVVFIAETSLGIIFLGFFVSSIYRRIAR